MLHDADRGARHHRQAAGRDEKREAQVLKDKLCGPNRRAITPLAMRFTSSRFSPQDFFPSMEEVAEPAQPAEPLVVAEEDAEAAEPAEPLVVEVEAKPAEPAEAAKALVEVEEPAKPVEPAEHAKEKEPEPVAAVEEPSDEWQMTVKGRTVSFALLKNAGYSPLGPLREVRECQVPGQDRPRSWVLGLPPRQAAALRRGPLLHPPGA